MTDWIGWHFLPDTGTLANGDGREVRVGETVTIEGPLELCRVGLHASKRLLDALRYAPGAVACQVRLSGEIIEGNDKACATERTVLGMVDATQLLHEYACDVAEKSLRQAGVTDERSWAAIATKRRWLAGQATDQELAAAWDAAWDAAWVAARAAARDAARAAAWVAARDAAWVAARDAAWVAARAAARDAAWVALSERLEQRLVAALEEAAS